MPLGLNVRVDGARKTSNNSAWSRHTAISPRSHCEVPSKSACSIFDAPIYDTNFKVRGEHHHNTRAVQPDPTTSTNFIVSMKSVFQAKLVGVNSSSFVVDLATMQARPASAAKCWHSRSKPSGFPPNTFTLLTTCSSPVCRTSPSPACESPHFLPRTRWGGTRTP